MTPQREGFLGPHVLALTGFVLGVLTLFGVRLMSGFTYLGFSLSAGAEQDHVAPQLLGAGLALLPLLFGLRALQYLPADAPHWWTVLARSACVLAVLSVIGRTVALLSSLLTDGPVVGQLLP